MTVSMFLLAEVLVSTVWYVWHAGWPGFVKQCTGNGADSEAQSASSAIRCNFGLMSMGIERNSLVATIQAREVALTAVYAQTFVDDGEFLVFIHIIDVLKMLCSGALHGFDSWHIADIDFRTFLSFFPKSELVSVLAELLHLEDGWALSLPSVLYKILALREVQKCPQTSGEVIDNGKVLFLNC